MKISNEKNKAIIYIILSAFCFTWMNIFVRLSGDIPSIEKSFFRNLVAAIVALVLMIRSGEGFHPQRRNIAYHLGRSIAGTIGIWCNFYAVDHLLLSNASMLNKLSPFFVLLFSYLVLKEKLTPFQIGVVVVAFAGALMVIKPSPANMDLKASMAGVLGGAAAGFAYTMVRKLSLRGESGTTIVLFFSTFSCLSAVPWVIANGVPISFRQLVILLAAGIAAAGGQFTITAAYSHAPGREVSIYDYSQIIFAALFGFFLFGDVPDLWSLAGYVVIVGAALGLFIYNNKE